ncbi:hypothetical protein [Glutamicibacter protophormiae]|uniref:hypothetical protein n=1 Tax=Glutamicibacter protophormiae TaxID=37930 RepID=UPI003A958E4C
MTDQSPGTERVPAPERPPAEGYQKFAGIDATVQDFWRFAMSDLRVNNTRGYLAEFFVARALGVQATRVEWDDYDVLWEDVKIEVKSSAYLQVWPQRKPSQIRFTGLRGRAWGDLATGLAEEATYKADVYVLCVQTTLLHADYDPLDITAWEFYVLSRRTLAEVGAKSLGLATVTHLTAPVPFDGLRAAVRVAAAANNDS